MKATVTRLTLKDAVKHVDRPIGRLVTLPALDGTLIEADEQAQVVRLHRTDLDTTVTAEVDADVHSGGRALIPSKALKGLVANGKDTVTLMAEDDEQITVISEAEVDVRAMILDDFPQLPTFDWCNGEAAWDEDTQDLIADVCGHASTEEARPVLTGITFDDGEVAATDSYRLGVAEVPTPGDGLFSASIVAEAFRWKAGKVFARLVNIKGSAAYDTLRLEGVAEAGPKKARRHVRMTLDVRTIEGTFPNYRNLWPDYDQHDDVESVTLVADEVVRALKGLDTFVKDAANTPVQLIQTPESDVLSFQVKNQSIGEGTSKTTPAELDGYFDGFAYNPAFFRKSIESAAGDGNRVTLRARDGLKPATFEGDGIDVLLMPMRIN